MKSHWADEFRQIAQSHGVDCKVCRRVNGWIETLVVANRRCFTKSMTYDQDRRQYFQGVDPKKLAEDGDVVILCGGANGRLRDVFVIPWDRFFATLRNGELVNSYRDREYWQYKFYVRDREDSWIMSVQGSHRPKLDIGGWRHDPIDAIEILRKIE